MAPPAAQTASVRAEHSYCVMMLLLKAELTLCRGGASQCRMKLAQYCPCFCLRLSEEFEPSHSDGFANAAQHAGACPSPSACVDRRSASTRHAPPAWWPRTWRCATRLTASPALGSSLASL